MKRLSDDDVEVVAYTCAYVAIAVIVLIAICPTVSLALIALKILFS